jgi:hypothetical protein
VPATRPSTISAQDSQGLETGNSVRWPRRGDAGRHPGILFESTLLTDGEVSSVRALPPGLPRHEGRWNRQSARTGAPRPTRLRVTRCWQQVSWLAGRSLRPPSQDRKRSQWYVGPRLAADSCGGSCGFALRAHRIPLNSPCGHYRRHCSHASLRASRRRRLRSPGYPLTIRRKCSHAAWIRFSLASGVRKAVAEMVE